MRFFRGKSNFSPESKARKGNKQKQKKPSNRKQKTKKKKNNKITEIKKKKGEKTKKHKNTQKNFSIINQFFSFWVGVQNFPFLPTWPNKRAPKKTQ